MPAIGVHHTETSDGAWDGPANEARLRLNESESYYRRAYAWQDPDGDPTTKAAYRFIHHEVDAAGNIGPANITACITGIAVLNGARGGTTIPEADRRGVYNHLAAHIRDAGREPPDLRQRSRGQHGAIEHRAFPVTELRVADESGSPVIRGHAAVFNQLSEPIETWFGFSFREKVAPGAFRKTIQEADIRALWNHDPNYVLGRNRAGTLRLAEDNRGLVVEIDPPATQWARDFLESIRRGDVTQMSFGFRVVRDHWESLRDHQTGESEDIRTLLEVRLFDVSPVTFPAYPQTDISVRDLLTDAGLDLEALGRVVVRRKLRLPISTSDRDLVQMAIEVLRSSVTEPAGSHSVHSPRGEPDPVHSPAWRERYLELLRLSL